MSSQQNIQQIVEQAKSLLSQSGIPGMEALQNIDLSALQNMDLSSLGLSGLDMNMLNKHPRARHQVPSRKELQKKQTEVKQKQTSLRSQLETNHSYSTIIFASSQKMKDIWSFKKHNEAEAKIYCAAFSDDLVYIEHYPNRRKNKKATELTGQLLCGDVHFYRMDGHIHSNELCDLFKQPFELVIYEKPLPAPAYEEN